MLSVLGVKQLIRGGRDVRDLLFSWNICVLFFPLKRKLPGAHFRSMYY